MPERRPQDILKPLQARQTLPNFEVDQLPCHCSAFALLRSQTGIVHNAGVSLPLYERQAKAAVSHSALLAWHASATETAQAVGSRYLDADGGPSAEDLQVGTTRFECNPEEQFEQQLLRCAPSREIVAAAMCTVLGASPCLVLAAAEQLQGRADHSRRQHFGIVAPVLSCLSNAFPESGWHA